MAQQSEFQLVLPPGYVPLGRATNLAEFIEMHKQLSGISYMMSNNLLPSSLGGISPIVEDIQAHINRLQSTISNFVTCTTTGKNNLYTTLPYLDNIGSRILYIKNQFDTYRFPEPNYFQSFITRDPNYNHKYNSRLLTFLLGVIEAMRVFMANFSGSRLSQLVIYDPRSKNWWPEQEPEPTSEEGYAGGPYDSPGDVRYVSAQHKKRQVFGQGSAVAPVPMRPYGYNPYLDEEDTQWPDSQYQQQGQPPFPSNPFNIRPPNYNPNTPPQQQNPPYGSLPMSPPNGYQVKINHSVVSSISRIIGFDGTSQ